jgi:hydroxylamine dehydrogenase
MPEACDQCHLGPDHPQIEIYEESKHGTIYHAYKDEYNFDAAGGTWTPGWTIAPPPVRPATCPDPARSPPATT